MSDKSLYSVTQECVNRAIDESPIGENGFAIEAVVRNAKESISYLSYSHEELFEKVVAFYAAVYANQLGYASGQKGRKIYFNRQIMNEGISMQLVINAQKNSGKYSAKANALLEDHEKRFLKKGVSGQMALDENCVDEPSIFEECSMDQLAEIVEADLTGTL